MKNNKKYFIGFGILAVLAVIFRFFDKKISELLFHRGNFFGGLCETVGSALPFALCAFCFATLIFCRHTRTTRIKNRILSVVFGIASLLSSAATVYAAMFSSAAKNYIAMAIAAIILTAVFITLGATLFKTSYQKILMTKHAKIGLISSAVSVCLYFVAKILPQRGSYAAIAESIEKFGNPDTPSEFVPLISLSGIGAALILWIVCFSDIFPKLRFVKKYFFAVSVIVAAAMLFGVISSGNCYGSEFIYGLAVGYIALFATSTFVEKKE